MTGQALLWRHVDGSATDGLAAPTAPQPQLVAPALRRQLVLAVGPLFGLFSVIMFTSSAVVSGHPWPTPERNLWAFLGCVLWSPMLAFCLRWCERRPLIPGSLPAGLLFHARRAILLSAASALGYYLLRLGGEILLNTQHFNLRSTAAMFLSAWVLADVLTYGIVLTAVSVAAAQRRLRERDAEAAKLEIALAKTEARLLRAQLDPHFLFNALHTVASLIHRDPQRADRVVCGLGEFLRLSLETAGFEEVTLEQEVAHLRSYLEIQTIRFPERFHFEFDVEPAALACLVPNLLLQPLVENVAKHAVATRVDTVHALLSARRDGEDLVVRVEDDGPGPGAAAGRREGIGLASTRSRLAKLYGERASFELRAGNAGGPGRGAIAEIRCPWNLLSTHASSELADEGGSEENTPWP